MNEGRHTVDREIKKIIYKLRTFTIKIEINERRLFLLFIDKAIDWLNFYQQFRSLVFLFVLVLKFVRYGLSQTEGVKVIKQSF